jgi:hypothetical protein
MDAGIDTLRGRSHLQALSPLYPGQGTVLPTGWGALQGLL